MKDKLKALISVWHEDYNQIKSTLIESGHKGDSLEYNLLAVEALRLMECINGATDLLIDDH